ncbi:hypothetical protein BJ322DRAFT_1092744 [Thelephora terrestris]|uniref:Uncharacterized protein n=1 Tax=Thelephora terrestris TaxID=56493 RepID=A0A9P6H5B0_9AGAM|nr:hypothetical protein BJ322DRAFT_1092744 [Thelephora terrestris]
MHHLRTPFGSRSRRRLYQRTHRTSHELLRTSRVRSINQQDSTLIPRNLSSPLNRLMDVHFSHHNLAADVFAVTGSLKTKNQWTDIDYREYDVDYLQFSARVILERLSCTPHLQPLVVFGNSTNEAVELGTHRWGEPTTAASTGRIREDILER